jgi:hypothetical protein
MNLCGVLPCPREGAEEVSEDCWLCIAHSVLWDLNEIRRDARVHELQRLRPDAAVAQVWAEHLSEWCGEQR